MEYNKYFVYFLGYLWADGSIEKYRCVLEIVEEDAIDIIDDIMKIDFLDIKVMRRSRKNRKPQMSIYFCNSKFYNDYISIYFKNKSFISPIKLINNIPDELLRYFYLGLIDGDGCWYNNKTNRQFYVSSCYNQDWSHIINLFEINNIINYNIKRIISNKNHKSSCIRLSKYSDIVKLYNYLYPNEYEIGLKRKYNKCLELVNNKPSKQRNKKFMIIN